MTRVRDWMVFCSLVESEAEIKARNGGKRKKTTPRAKKGGKGAKLIPVRL